MASKVTKWGIAGAGRISSSFATGVNMLPSHEHKIMAIASRSLERSTEFGKKFDIPKTYGSYEELAADKDIDVVYLGVIHPSHLPLIKLYLNSGHHVLCEKPLTVNARQAKEAIDLAKSKGLFLMEGFWSRFFPVYDTLREELKLGTIGEAKIVHVNFGYVDKATSGWTVDKSSGAGALLSLGCYCIMFSQLVYKHETPEKITAIGILNDKTGSDDTVSITLTYSGQRVANIMTSNKNDLGVTATIYGTEGCIKIPSFYKPDEISTPSGTKHHPIPKALVEPIHSRGEGFMYQAQSVRECLLKGLTENPLMTWDQSLQIQTILDEIRRQIGLVYDDDDVKS